MGLCIDPAKVGVHAAIVTGRDRHETGNYRLCSRLAGKISTLFTEHKQQNRPLILKE